jgi:Fic family protein
MNPPALEFLLAEIDRRQAEWTELRRSLLPDRRDRIDRKVRIEWNTYSNNIEGNTYTLAETQALLHDGKKAPGKKAQEHRDILGHDEAITRVFQLVEDRQEFSESAIRALHEVLMKGDYEVEMQTPDGQRITRTMKAGAYKMERNFVRAGGQSKEYVLPEETPARMDAMIRHYRQDRDAGVKHPLVLAAELHYEFTAIHPFPDGNGRMARLLNNWVLLAAGFPPVILLPKERDQYIDALRAADAAPTEIVQLERLLGSSLLTALDLHCRGARGEEIFDMTDLDKELALLKHEAASRPSPMTCSDEAIRMCFQHSLIPLLTRLCTKLAEFDEFFAEASVTLNVVAQNPHPGSRGGWVDIAASMPKQEIVPKVEELLREGIRDRLSVYFTWQNFTKGGTEDLSFGAHVSFRFEALRYVIDVEGAGPNLRHKHWYQHELGEETIREIVDSIRRPFLERVRQAIRAGRA